MIQANELRIGNYVTTITASENEYTKVNGNDFWHYQNIDNPLHRVEWNSLKPIQLTEEWLLKLGFSLSYESEYRRKLDLDINTQFGYDFDLNGNANGMQGFRHYGRYYKCEYVHILQNLHYFLSNGTELTLTP